MTGWDILTALSVSNNDMDELAVIILPEGEELFVDDIRFNNGRLEILGNT